MIPLYAPRVPKIHHFIRTYWATFTLTIGVTSHFANMSDYEDEMDVDDAPVKESVMFSSDNTNTKGKRSAANLPIEAEDSLPW